MFQNVAAEFEQDIAELKFYNVTAEFEYDIIADLECYSIILILLTSELECFNITAEFQ